MRFKLAFSAACIALIGTGLLSLPAVHAYSLTGSQLMEDFSTDTFADYAATTGLWNTVGPCAGAGCAQAGVVADAAGSGTTRPLTFGDGSDGILNSGAGFTFDTNAHPTGYNFKSVNISGGAISVTGTNPLIIRSLSTINIVPTLAVNGPNGADGTSAAAGSTPGGAGGTAITCQASGGAGGTASTAAGSAGTDGAQSDGSVEANTGGAGRTATGYQAAEEAGAAVDGPTSTNFETATNFICGAGGGGGGGYSDGAAAYSTGAGGGAGGGIVRLAAVGNINFTVLQANGGNGGNGSGGAGFCSGNGSAGYGGSVWLQSLNSINAGTLNVTTGNPGTSACGTAGSFAANGVTRADSTAPGGGPAATTTFSTTNAAASQTYTVQSKPYDLGTASAIFTTAPSVTMATNGGTITVSYAASPDGSSYSPFTTDITTLSRQGYRYLKFRITIVTGGAAAVSPNVSRLSIPFSDIPGAATGPTSLDLKLSPGCGAIRNHDGTTPPAGPLALYLGSWLLFWILTHQVLRRSHRY